MIEAAKQPAIVQKNKMIKQRLIQLFILTILTLSTQLLYNFDILIGQQIINVVKGRQFDLKIGQLSLFIVQFLRGCDPQHFNICLIFIKLIICIMKHQGKQQEFVFCYNHQNPATLVMLQRPQRIPQLILNSHQDSMFMWVGSLENSQHMKVINTIQAQLGVFVFLKQNAQQVEKDILQNRTTGMLVIICTPEFYEEVSQLRGTHKQVHKIICFTNNKEFHYEMQIPNLIRNDILKLVKWLAQQKKVTQTEKILPNFLFVSELQKGDIQISNKLLQSMIIMLKQDIDKVTKDKIVDQLARVVQVLQQMESKYQTGHTNTQQFLHELKGQMDSRSAIKWYTRQSIVNKLFNNLLRTTRSSKQIFYMQPYFKLLFQAISQLHKQQKVVNLKCYRGGIISQDQIRMFQGSKGNIVQNLGFLSTSVNLKVAERFAENVIFEISVNEQNKVSHHNWGFANISNFSHYYQEAQILFNPINSFKVLDVISDKDKRIYIKMEYNPAQFLEQDRIFIQNARSICKQLKNEFQGIILSNYVTQSAFDQYYQRLSSIISSLLCEDKEFSTRWQLISQLLLGNRKMKEGRFSEAMTQFKKAIQIETNSLAINFSVFNDIGLCYLEAQQFQAAQEFFQKAQQISNKIQAPQNIDFLIPMVNLGRLYTLKGNLEAAEDILKKCLQIVGEFKKENTIIHAKVMSLLASLFQAKGFFKQALEQHQKSYNLKMILLGINHPQTLVQLHNIANTHSKIGNVKIAESTFINCLSLQRNLLGKNNPNFHITLRNLGNLYSKQGKLKMAYQILSFSIQVQKKLYGQEDPRVLKLLNNLGTLYQTANKIQLALQTYQSCLKKQEKVLGITHPHYLLTLDNLSLLYCQTGRRKISLHLNQYCIKTRSQVESKAHPNYFHYLNNKAFIYLVFGHKRQSSKIYLSCLNQGSKKLGLTHRFTQKVLARILQIQSKDIKYWSLPLFLKYYKLVGTQIENGEYLLKMLNHLAIIYMQKGNLSKSVRLYGHRLILSIRCKTKQWEQILCILYTLIVIHADMADFEKFTNLQICYKFILQQKIELKQKYGKSFERTVRRINRCKDQILLKKYLSKIVDKMLVNLLKSKYQKSYFAELSQFSLEYHRRSVQVLRNIYDRQMKLESKIFGQRKMNCLNIKNKKMRISNLWEKLYFEKKIQRKNQRVNLI